MHDAVKLVRESFRLLSNDMLAFVWLETERRSMSEELALTRSWILEELERRMPEDVFDEWLYADSVSPAPYLA